MSEENLNNENRSIDDEMKTNAEGSRDEYRRPPYMRDGGSTYTSDRYQYQDNPNGGGEGYAYTSRNTQSAYNPSPKKKGGGKVIAAVVVAALVLGGVIGGACMMLGINTRNTGSFEVAAVEETTQGVETDAAEIGTTASEVIEAETEAAEAGTEVVEADTAATDAADAEMRALPDAESEDAVSEEAGTEAALLEAETTEAHEATSVAAGLGLAGAAQETAALETPEESTEDAYQEEAVTEEEVVVEESGTEDAEGIAVVDGSAEIATAQAEEAQEESSEEMVKAMDVTDVVEMAMPSVVSITTKAIYERYNQNDFDPFYYFFGGYGGYGNYGNQGGQGGQGGQYEVTGAGSGIILGDNGEELWIVTNNHVVSGAESLTVNFCDDTTANAYIKGTDANNDLAVVGVKLSDLSDTTKSAIAAIQMGDSDSLRLGETTIAIGNALGLGQSVSTGVVSAINRQITTSEGTTLTTIQTDAAINPGNSGGALLNSRGQLIGINVAKDAETDVEGMGYAIPISNAKKVIEKLTTLASREEVSEDQYPYIGVQLNEVSADVAKTYGMPVGVMVYSLVPDGPAAKAGLYERDIITAFDGYDVTTYQQLTDLLKYYPGGTTVNITVQRQEQGQYKEVEIPLTLGLKSDYETAAPATETQPSQPETEAPSQQNGGGLPGGSFGSWNGFNFGN